MSDHATNRRFERSLALHERASKALVGGGQPHKRSRLPWPLVIERGSGCRIWDADGNEYIDYLMGYGPVLLGHAYPRVIEAVTEHVRRGNVYNVGHPLEIVLAEKLIQLIPAAERVAFFVGGSAATTGAVKFARAFTGREKVVRCGYHGWHDWSHSERGALQAIAAYTLTMTFNDLDSLEELFRLHRGEIACVILEPTCHELPHDGYLQGLNRLCHDNGALLVFDEVKTGFRYALGGAQEHFGVTPDLAVFSKAMGNGFSGAVVVGKADILDSTADVWIVGTFHGEVSFVAAAIATIAEMEDKRGVAHLWRQGDTLLAGYREMTARLGVENVRFGGAGPMPFFGIGGGDERLDRMRDVFYEEALDRGLYLPDTHIWFTSLSHTDEDIARTLDISEQALRVAKEAY